MAMDDDQSIIGEQIAYYRARAEEYDEWFLRRGRYDRGEEHRREWSAEICRVEKDLREWAPLGDVLELACGTGLWTQVLAPLATSVTAVDVAPEAIDINRHRTQSDRVHYVVADLFDWTPLRAYDFVFFGFWLSHVPEERFEAFWRLVRAALRPGGRAFFVDGLLTQDSTAKDHCPIDLGGVVERKLNDGRVFRIVKVFHEPAGLEKRLSALGWQGWVRSAGRFFYYGCVSARCSERHTGE